MIPAADPRRRPAAPALDIRAVLDLLHEEIGGALQAPTDSPAADEAARGAGARPALRRDARHALTLPFAEMITEAASPRAWAIDRRLVDAFVAVVADRHATPELRAAFDRFAALPPDVAPAEEDAVLAGIWHHSAMILDRALRGGAADFREIVLCLRAAPEIQAMRRYLPFSPVPELDIDQVRFAAETCERLFARQPQAVPAFLHALTARLRFPEEIAKVVRALHTREGGRMRWEALTDSVIDRIVGVLETMVAGVAGDSDDERRLIGATRDMVRLLHCLAVSTGVPKAGEAGRRVAAARTLMAQRLDHIVLEGAAEIIIAGFLPGWATGDLLAGPTFAQLVASGVVARAERRAAAIAEIRLMAEELAISGQLRAVLIDVERAGERYGDRLLEAIDRNGDGPYWLGPSMSLVHILELLFGSERGDRFRRRVLTRLKQA